MQNKALMHHHCWFIFEIQWHEHMCVTFMLVLFKKQVTEVLNYVLRFCNNERNVVQTGDYSGCCCSCVGVGRVSCCCSIAAALGCCVRAQLFIGHASVFLVSKSVRHLITIKHIETTQNSGGNRLRGTNSSPRLVWCCWSVWCCVSTQTDIALEIHGKDAAQGDIEIQFFVCSFNSFCKSDRRHVMLPGFNLDNRRHLRSPLTASCQRTNCGDCGSLLPWCTHSTVHSSWRHLTSYFYLFCYILYIAVLTQNV